ncbi:MAG TPA: V-type ATP synthase subunit B, partial [Thermoplasmata archaeon]|nr:V-type ATP synthase subunit B [Thermoplasmata archaeon]
FAAAFEDRFVRQSKDEDRTIQQTLDLGWELLSALPVDALTKIDRKFIEKYHPMNRKK